MASDPTLERAIDEAPDDDARRLVYADWLQQQGDARGELAIVQHALATAPTAALQAPEQTLATAPTAALQAREQTLLTEVLGPLAIVLASADGEALGDGLDVQWRLGFLDSIRITSWPELYDCLAAERDRFPEVVALLPDEDDGLDVRGLLRLIAHHPAARFLRRVRLGATSDEAAPLYDYFGDGEPSLLDTLVELALPSLTALELGAMDCRQGETEMSWIALGNAGKVLRAYPRLREVKLTGACAHFEATSYRGSSNPWRLELGTLDLPELRRFALRTTDLRRAQLAAVCDAHWPALEALELWFGSAVRGAECRLDDVLPLLEQPSQIRHLGLRNAEWTDELIDPLAASPLLEQLHTLDLSLGCLTDDGAAELRDHAPAFRHLRRLVLDRSLLSRRGLAAVAGLCADVSVADQREPFAADERYVAVGE